MHLAVAADRGARRARAGAPEPLLGQAADELVLRRLPGAEADGGLRGLRRRRGVLGREVEDRPSGAGCAAGRAARRRARLRGDGRGLRGGGGGGGGGLRGDGGGCAARGRLRGDGAGCAATGAAARRRRARRRARAARRGRAARRQRGAAAR
ncbi:hypothetical protein [Sorangium cellulosum]|uniref:hypothetical protein n=1 Tax=Sorangium cellulosum TaxID=56 RepID=UPI001A9257F8|nr:hypothetical protein [Sorangium cellulosum]